MTLTAELKQELQFSEVIQHAINLLSGFINAGTPLEDLATSGEMKRLVCKGVKAGLVMLHQLGGVLGTEAVEIFEKDAVFPEMLKKRNLVFWENMKKK